MRYLALVALIASGCSLVGHGPGVMRPDGTIIGCGAFYEDGQACGNAIWNAKVIPRVTLGQTPAEVRKIMEHDAERRDFSANEERWYYITDYDAELMTVIVFTDGRVSALSHAPWSN